MYTAAISVEFSLFFLVATWRVSTVATATSLFGTRSHSHIPSIYLFTCSVFGTVILWWLWCSL